MTFKSILSIIWLLSQLTVFGASISDSNKNISVMASKPAGIKNFSCFQDQDDFYFVGEREREGAINFEVSVSVTQPDFTLKSPSSSPVSKSTNGGLITSYEVTKDVGGEMSASGNIYFVVVSAEIAETFEMNDDTLIGISQGTSENPQTKITVEAVGASDWSATMKVIPDDQSVEVLPPMDLSSSSNSTNLRITKGYSLQSKETKQLEITFDIKGNDTVVMKNLDLLPVDLEIYSGQAAANAVPEKDEEIIGAFTVANLNDTDGDGTVDNGDNTVKKGAAGEDEEDLMKLIIKGPNLGRMKVTVVSGNVEFWEKSTKETKIAKQGNAIFIDGADLPKTLWIEATNNSNALRDIELKLGFEAPSGQLTDDLDKVKATAVWAERTSTKNKNGEAIWADADDAAFLNLFNFVGDFGIQFGATRLFYTIGFEFTVKPNGIGNEPNVKFDITRDIAFKDWTINGNNVALRPFAGKDDVFDSGDKTDDDSHDGDEDNIPKNNHIYVIDAPGEGVNALNDQVVSRNNFEEFVRVSFDGTKPTGNNDGGSRCSNNIPWHAFYWIEKNPATGKYRPRAGKLNRVQEGHLPIGVAPNS